MIKLKLPDKSLHTLTSTSLEPAEILQLSCTFNSCEEGASRFVDANPINPESIEGLLAPILAGLFGLPYDRLRNQFHNPRPQKPSSLIVHIAQGPAQKCTPSKISSRRGFVVWIPARRCSSGCKWDQQLFLLLLLLHPRSLIPMLLK